MVGCVHWRAGRGQGGERGAGGQRSQGLRGVVGAFGFALGQRVGGKHGAVSGDCLWGKQVTEVRVKGLSSALVALILGETVDVTETDGAEGASAGRQGTPTGG